MLPKHGIVAVKRCLCVVIGEEVNRGIKMMDYRISTISFTTSLVLPGLRGLL